MIVQPRMTKVATETGIIVRVADLVHSGIVFRVRSPSSSESFELWPLWQQTPAAAEELENHSEILAGFMFPNVEYSRWWHDFCASSIGGPLRQLEELRKGGTIGRSKISTNRARAIFAKARKHIANGVVSDGTTPPCNGASIHYAQRGLTAALEPQKRFRMWAVAPFSKGP